MQSSVPQPVFFNVEYLFNQFYHFSSGFFSFLFSTRFIQFINVLATLIIIGLIIIILYSLVRLKELEDAGKKKKPKAVFSETTAGPGTETLTTDGLHTQKNATWENLRAKLLSDNPSEWRLAIIEADIYLDRLLDNKGFHGETIGDKLKQVTPDQIGSIQIAWETHKVRNRIAHDGAAFVLTQPEARRLLGYYEIIFRDFEVID